MFGKKRKDLRCSFCGKQREQVEYVIAGPGVYICDECIALCNHIIEVEAKRDKSPSDLANRELRCSFCAKSYEQVANLIAGPGVFICTECVDLCNEIISKAIPHE